MDATTFEHRGKRYLIWSQKDPADERNASLYISAMAGPTELRGPEVLIAEPEYPWEMEGIPSNLGPSVLIKNGRVFVTYSGGATDRNAAIGLLWADASADLLDAASWHKLPEPVLSTNESLGRYGPGHSSFTRPLTAAGTCCCITPATTATVHALIQTDTRGRGSFSGRKMGGRCLAVTAGLAAREQGCSAPRVKNIRQKKGGPKTA